MDILCLVKNRVMSSNPCHKPILATKIASLLWNSDFSFREWMANPGPKSGEGPTNGRRDVDDAQNTTRATQHQQPVSSVPRWPCCQASSAPGRARSRGPLSSPRLSPARWPLSTRLPRAPSRSLARGSMLPVRPAGSRSTRSSPVTGESLFVNPVVSPPSSALYGHALLDRRVFLTPFSPFFPPAAFPRSTLVVGPGVLFSTTHTASSRGTSATPPPASRARWPTTAASSPSAP